MHLLLAQKGSLSDAEEAVDLGQSPGEIVFLTAADTESASVSLACEQGASVKWRVANLGQLRHPLSVDSYIECTARHAKLIIVRALGGAGYFSYALETLYASARENGSEIIVLPGDDKPDPELDQFCTLPTQIREQLWAYLVEGGADNIVNFIAMAEHVFSGTAAQADFMPIAARPLLKAGLYWPDRAVERLEALREKWTKGAPTVAICFYRALVQSSQTAPVDALIQALQKAGVNALPIFVSSLKDDFSKSVIDTFFDQTKPVVVINLTGFAVSKPGAIHEATVLDKDGAIVLQGVLAGTDHARWLASDRGLNARDLAMHIALPEVDGRVMTRAISFKSADYFSEQVQTNIVRHAPDQTGVDYVAALAANWAKLSATPTAQKQVALIMANYPNRDGRLANGVGLDTPQSVIEVCHALEQNGYLVDGAPSSQSELMSLLRAYQTNAHKQIQTDQDLIQSVEEVLELDQYLNHFKQLPLKLQKEIRARWGEPDDDLMIRGGKFVLPLHRFGNIFIGIQPARGYNIDPSETYHCPDLVPPHFYLAFYFYLRHQTRVHTVVHMGKHGNLEWLPGKALALSETCYPGAILGPIPHIYPFIVNDPGEGTQSKRRTSAVIIDHLTPPLTRAESYGPLKDLEVLVDEFYMAAGQDPRRIKLLRKQIFELMQDSDLGVDVGLQNGDDSDAALEKLDAYLCALKEMQIRDGLHIFGRAPEGRLQDDLVVALARLPRGHADKDQSLHRAIAADLSLKFDPLDCDMAKVWDGLRPDILLRQSTDPWRSHGDTVERIELLASTIVSGAQTVPEAWANTRAVMQDIHKQITPNVAKCGVAEINAILTALDGRFVAPGPSGAPTRGRPDVLPTGRNFYSVDSRCLPTPAAWELGQKSAELLIQRYVQDHGNWPTSFGLTAWGTSNMRTGGDDLAQALALIGVKPTWDMASRRMTGFEIIPLAKLGRPRVDVTLRVSGFFRDAFPDQIALIDQAIKAVSALEEDAHDNPIAMRSRQEQARLIAKGMDQEQASRMASYRIFGSKPGSYGAGLQALMDEKGWNERQDLADSYIIWGGYAYGAGEEGLENRELFQTRLGTIEAVVQNQDNREHDLLDSDDYYQFEGGMTAAVEMASGEKPTAYHNDHSRPEKPVIRTLEEEISRVVRSRVINPKWIAGVMRHGYKGAFEMAATLDYMFAFAATTGAVRDHHFELTYQAYLGDKKVRDFIERENPDALTEMAERFLEAEQRGLWHPRSNSAKIELQKLSEREVEHVG